MLKYFFHQFTLLTMQFNKYLLNIVKKYYMEHLQMIGKKI